MVKTIFFDFGGCLDAPGIHTRTLFFDAFVAEKLVDPSQRPAFQEAYTKADQRMMNTGEAKELALGAFNRHNAQLIADELGVADSAAAADRVTKLMRGYLAESRRAVAPLRAQFELGIISNFTGNLEVILREFGMREMFATVTESFYAGASKPDEKIFRVALGSRQAGECVYVGDNPVNDIAPAKRFGMSAALIHPPGLRKECGADFYAEDLVAFSSWIQNR